MTPLYLNSRAIVIRLQLRVIMYSMDGQPEDFIEIPLNIERGGLEQLDRDFQGYQLLIRNQRYLDEVERIRKLYRVGEYPIDSDNYYTVREEMEGPKNAKGFAKEVKILSDRINLRGDWFDGVRLHILGFEPEAYLYPVNPKKLQIKRHPEYLELRIYGDVTQPELRKHLKTVRKHISLGCRPKPAKFKPQLQKNLLIYELNKKGYSYNQIVETLERKGLLKTMMSQEDVSKYIELVEEQIEKILA